MSDVEVRIEGLPQLRSKLTAAPALIDRHRRATLVRGAVLVRDEARRRIHSPGGHAARGIRYVVKGDESVTIRPGRGAAGKAAVFAQRSRAPGKTPPPMKAARAIARRYGIPANKARAVALAIAHRGTKGTPVMAASLRAKRDELHRLFKTEVRDAFIRSVTQ